MVHRSFRSRVDQPDWDFLALCIALVCRNALPATPEEPDRWRRLDSMLARIGAEARQAQDGDLPFCVLADFAGKAPRQAVLARARQVAAELPERDLRALTRRAGALVDRTCPDQAFRFRAVLTLVAMMAAGELPPSLDSMLSDDAARL